MVERNSSHEKEASKVGAVVIMYPDMRTTGGGLRDIDELTGTFEGEFRETSGKILTRYKREGIPITGIVYSDTSPEYISTLYPQELFDTFISVEVPFLKWEGDKHKRYLRKVVENIPRHEGKIVVGGYHAFDCVVTMAQVLELSGQKAEPNLLLTDQLGELLLHHRARRFFAPYDIEERGRDRELWRKKYDRFERLVHSSDFYRR